MHAPPWGQEMDYNLMHKDGQEQSPPSVCNARAAGTRTPSRPTRSSSILVKETIASRMARLRWPWAS